MTFKESIALNRRNGVKHTPELKSGDAARLQTVFGGQEGYAQKLIDELEAAGVRPRDAWPQSLNLDDVLYWIDHAPAYGRRAVYLDDWDPAAGFDRLSLDELRAAKNRGVRIFAPPIPALLTVSPVNEIVPSQYAIDIKSVGLEIITWSFERSDLRNGASRGGFYYGFDPQGLAVKKDSDMYKAIDVLAKKVGVIGLFSDWPATVTYYANCMGLK